MNPGRYCPTGQVRSTGALAAGAPSACAAGTAHASAAGQLVVASQVAFAAHFTRGRECALAGDVAAAEVEYRAAVAADPTSVEARLALATVLLASGRPEEAEPDFQAVWDAGVPAALAGLAICMNERGAAEAARALLESGLARGTEDPIARDLLAELGPSSPGLDEEIEAIGLGFNYGEDRLRLRCRRCGSAWEEVIASAMCERLIACGSCGARTRVLPEAFIAAAERLHPSLSVANADTLDAAAAAMVAGWHADTPLADVGAWAEHPMLPLVLDAILSGLSGSRP